MHISIKQVNSSYLLSALILIFSHFGLLYGQENPVHRQFESVVTYLVNQHNYKNRKIDIVFTNDHLSWSQYYIVVNGRWLCISYNYGDITDEFVESDLILKQLNYIKKKHYRKIHSDCIYTNCNGCPLINTYRLNIRPKIMVIKSRYLAEDSCF